MRYSVLASEELDQSSHVKECMLGLFSAGDNTSQLSSLHGGSLLWSTFRSFSLFYRSGFLVWSSQQEQIWGKWTDLNEHLLKHKVHKAWITQCRSQRLFLSRNLSWHQGTHTSERKYIPLFKHSDSPHCSRSTLAWCRSTIVTLAKMGGLWSEGRKWTIL